MIQQIAPVLRCPAHSKTESAVSAGSSAAGSGTISAVTAGSAVGPDTIGYNSTRLVPDYSELIELIGDIESRSAVTAVSAVAVSLTVA
ncbi:MAG TPA: hypothetical protein PK054_12085, partial [Anaerohalosphaeraceae bacterium]|nr:hypothetical protein [Anaerohalosphaeraceae bacterium]